MAKKKGATKPVQGKSKGKNNPHYKRKKKDKEEEELEVVEVKDFIDEEGHDVVHSDDDAMDTTETRKMVFQQNKKKKKSGGFQSMGLSSPVYKGVMKKGYKIPTPIQRKAVPVIMDGKDVVAMARTGSGKTAAFLIPMFEKLQSHSAKSGARALIMSPTRELALQTLKFIKELGRFTGIHSAVVLGGDSFESQFAAIHKNPDVIVATPGRFLHVITEMDLKLSSVEYVVFDEADRLFELGFAEQLREIIHKLPDARQTLLFSATLPRLLVDFAKAGLTDPTLIRLDVDSKISEQLKVVFLHCRADDKQAILLHLLQNVIRPTEQTLVFAATKHHVEYLKELLSASGITCSYVYSSLDQTARTINVSKFQHKKTMVMVVTDVAARGIDIPMLDNVINFHFPSKSKLFVHRVGRVARAGRTGTAYSLVANDEVAHMVDLHLFLGRPLKLATTDSTNDDADLLGRVPQRIVDDEEDFLRTAHEQSHDLSSLQSVYVNAYKQYLRSRPNASSESVKRAKELVLSTIAVHPVIGSADDQSTVTQAQLLEGVRTFKSRQTIFEVGPTSKSCGHRVMKLKRQRHEGVIEKAHQKKRDQDLKTSVKHCEGDGACNDLADDSDIQGLFTTVIDSSDKKRSKSGPSKSFRDENYIPHRSLDHYAEKGLGLELSTFEKEAAGSVIEIKGDDEQRLRQSKNIKKWDRKRKMFIGADEKQKKKIRTESGALIPATYKKDIYKNWIKKNKMNAPGVGRNIEDTDEPPGKWGKRGKSGKRGPGRGGKAGGASRNELKSTDQILKARKTKEKLMQRQKMGKQKNQRRKMIKSR